MQQFVDGKTSASAIGKCIASALVHDVSDDPDSSLLGVVVINMMFNGCTERTRDAGFIAIRIICKDRCAQNRILKSHLPTLEKVAMSIMGNAEFRICATGISALYSVLRLAPDFLTNGPFVRKITKKLCLSARSENVEAIDCLNELLSKYTKEVQQLVISYIRPVIYEGIHSRNEEVRLACLNVFIVLIQTNTKIKEDNELLLSCLLTMLTEHNLPGRYDERKTMNIDDCAIWHAAGNTLKHLLSRFESAVDEVITFIRKELHNEEDGFEAEETKTAQLIRDDCILLCKYPSFGTNDCQGGLIAFEALLKCVAQKSWPTDHAVCNLSQELLPTLIELMFHPKLSIRSKSIDVCYAIYTVFKNDFNNLETRYKKYLMWALNISLVSDRNQSEEVQELSSFLYQKACKDVTFACGDVELLKQDHIFITKHGLEATITLEKNEQFDSFEYIEGDSN